MENRMSLNWSKTWEMVMSGKTQKPLPPGIGQIERKQYEYARHMVTVKIILTGYLERWSYHYFISELKFGVPPC